jgi:hypothetical protein
MYDILLILSKRIADMPDLPGGYRFHISISCLRDDIYNEGQASEFVSRLLIKKPI